MHNIHVDTDSAIPFVIAYFLFVVSSLVALLLIGNIIRESSSSTLFFWLLSAFNIVVIFSSNLAIVTNNRMFASGVLLLQLVVNIFALIFVYANGNYHFVTSADTAGYIISLCLSCLSAISGIGVAYLGVFNHD